MAENTAKAKLLGDIEGDSNNSHSQSVAEWQLLPSSSENLSTAWQEFADLCFRQALYDFPAEKIAIIDEDGHVIATNNNWQACSENRLCQIEYTAGVAVNYFDFLRLLLPYKDALNTIAKLREVISGRANRLFSRYTLVRDFAQNTGEIIAYPLNDIPNALVVIHRLNRTCD